MLIGSSGPPMFSESWRWDDAPVWRCRLHSSPEWESTSCGLGHQFFYIGVYFPWSCMLQMIWLIKIHMKEWINSLEYDGIFFIPKRTCLMTGSWFTSHHHDLSGALFKWGASVARREAIGSRRYSPAKERESPFACFLDALKCSCRDLPLWRVRNPVPRCRSWSILCALDAMRTSGPGVELWFKETWSSRSLFGGSGWFIAWVSLKVPSTEYR
jgi:hypothetical protein